MHRDTLKQLLNAGPSRRLDVSGVSQTIARRADGGDYFFATRFLNSSVFFKYVDPACPAFRRNTRPIGTLIYSPYDVQRPADGGESVMFSQSDFPRLCENKIASGGLNRKDLVADAEKLRVLDSLPTFCPFIVELAFKRAQVEIPKAYLQLTPRLRETLTAHLKGRLRPLVVAAYQKVAAHVEESVEELTATLFCLRNVDELQPLTEALRLSPDLAQDVFGSWIGITYYEYEFAALQLKLREFAAWISQNQRMAEGPSNEYRLSISSLVDVVRRQVRGDWSEMITISENYRSSYEAMVFKGDIEPFIAFLRTAQGSYWRMGEVLGKLEQAVRVWSQFDPPARERRGSSPQLLETLSVLRDLLLDGSPQPQARATLDPGRAAARL